MTLSPGYQRWVLAGALLSIAAFGLADNDIALAFAGIVGVLAAFVVTNRLGPDRVPRALVNALLFLAVAWAALTALRAGRLGVEAFGEFVVLLMALKTLDRRRVRDTAQIITLSVFLSVAAILTSNSLPVGVLLVAFVFVLLCTLVLHQVEAAHAAASGPGVTPRSDTAAVWRAVRRLLLLCSAPVFATSIAVFLFMPRGFGVATFGRWGEAAAGQVVGFDDELNLGRGGLISESPETLLDLRVVNRDGRSEGAEGRRFYLRGAILDTYVNGVWRRGDGDRLPGSIRGDLRSPHAVGGRGQNRWNIEQQVTIRNVGRAGSHIFASWVPRRLLVEGGGYVRYSDRDHEMRLEDRQGRVTYSVYCDTFLSEIDSDDDRVFTTGPRAGFENAAIREIALGVLARSEAGVFDREAGRALDAWACANLLAHHLARDPFVYSLDIPATPVGRDPTEWFLTEGHTGHCQYFAGSVAAMCLAVGVPARVVAGYVASEYNESTDHYIVRASDAHAWVEVETAPGVWRTLDPTPTADFTRIHDPEESIAASLRRFFDTIEFAWVRNVVGYDADTRAELLGVRRDDGARLAALFGDAFERISRRSNESLRHAAGDGLAVAIAVFVAASLVGVGVHAMRTGRLADATAWLIAVLRPEERSRALTLAVAVQRRLAAILARRGVARPEHTPLVAHLRGLRGRVAWHDELVVLDRAAGMLYDHHFAGRHHDVERWIETQRELAPLLKRRPAGRSSERPRPV